MLENIFPSKHAQQRMSQRAIREADLPSIWFGSPVGEDAVMLTERDARRRVQEIKRQVQEHVRWAKREIQKLERQRNCKIVHAGNRLLSCYHTTRRHRRAVMRRAREAGEIE